MYGPLVTKAAPSAVQLVVSAAPEGTGAYAGWAHSCKNVGMASASTTVSVRPSADHAGDVLFDVWSVSWRTSPDAMSRR